MPDIRMPDGTIIRNVPEGITKDALLKKLSANGVDTAKLLAPPQEENTLEKIPLVGDAAAWLADIPLGVVEGVANTGKSLSDVFGAGNPVSDFLGGVAEGAADWKSSEARTDAAINAIDMEQAGDEGAWEQIKAAGRSFARSPLDTTASVVGSAIPFIGAALAAPASGGSSLAPIAAMAGLGAASGAGIIKGAVYDATLKQAKLAGVSEERAQQLAEEAQAYGGENLDQIGLGTAIGALASATGLPRQIASAIGKRAAAEAAEAVAAQTTRRSLLAGGVKGAVEEAVPEALQGGQEKYAANLALNRQGYDVDPMEGVIGQGAFEGLASLALGGFGGVREASAANVQGVRDEIAAVAEELPEDATPEQMVSATERFTRWGINEETANTIVSRLAETKRALAEQQRQEAEARRTAAEQAAPEMAEETPLPEAPPVDPVEEAARVRAYEAEVGATDTSLPTLFHGGRRGMTTDDVAIVREPGASKQSKKNRVYGGFYATTNPQEAAEYAAMSQGDNTVYQVRLQPNAVVEQIEADITRLSPQTIEEYRTRGVDVVVGQDVRGRTEYAIINRDAISGLEDLQATPPPTAPESTAPSITPAQAAAMMDSDAAIQNFADQLGIDTDEAIERLQQASVTGLKYSRGRPPKTTADDGLFGALPTQDATRLDKREELEQLKLATTPEQRIAQQEEVGEAASERIAQRAQQEEEQRIETLGDIEYALRAQAPENAVYKVDYDPTDTKAPYKLLAETKLGVKPEVVKTAATLQEFSDAVYGDMMELTPYVPAPTMSAQTVEKPDTTEPTVATQMIQQFTQEVDAAREAGQIDNNQRSQLLGRLERPDAYVTLPNGTTKPRDPIAQLEYQAVKAMEAYRNAENDQQREEATGKLDEVNQRLTAAVQNSLLNPIRATMRSMIENRQDERLGARIRQRDAKTVLAQTDEQQRISDQFALQPAQQRFERTPDIPQSAEQLGIENIGQTQAAPGQRGALRKVSVGTAPTGEAVFGELSPEQREGRTAAQRELREAKIDERETKVQKYKRGTGTGMPAGTVERIAKDITSKWKSRVPVTVVATTANLPGELRAAVEADGATDAKGFVNTDGTVYLIAANLSSEEEARATLFHEGLGHIGLEKLFREELDTVLNTLYDTNKNLRAATNAWLKANPDAYAGDPNRVTRAVEEVLAERSEQGVVPQSIIQKLVAFVRSFARRLGFDLDMTDADVSAILTAAHQRVVKGDGTSSAVKGIRYILGRKVPKNQQPKTTPKTKAELLREQGDISTGLRRTVESQTVYGMAQGLGDAVRARSGKPFIDGLKENFDGMKPSAFKAILSALPTSGILDWFGKESTALRDVDKHINLMVNMKANIIAAGDEIAKRIEAFVDKHGNDTLAAAMSTSRINEYSPDEFKTMAEALKQHGVIVEVEGRLLSDTNDAKRTRQLLDELKALVVAGKSRKKVAPDSEKARFTPEAKRLINELEKVAVDPSEVERRAEQIVEMSQRIRDVHLIWDELAKQTGGHKLYRDIRQFYKDMFEAELALLDERIAQVGDEEQVKRLRDERAKMMRNTVDPDDAKKAGDKFWDVDANLFQKDYFPFMREGKFWLTVKGDPKTRERQFYTFPSAKERDRALAGIAKKMGANPEDKDIFSKGNDIATLQKNFRNEDAMMQRVFEIINKAKEDAAVFKQVELDDVRDAIYQTWLMTSPERSVRRRLLHAEEVTGFSSDVLNHFSRQVTAYANQLSKMAYAGRIRMDLDAAEENFKDRPVSERAKLGDVVQEIGARAEQEINPEPQSAFVNMLNRASFFYYLTAPATAMVQLTSIPIRVVPRLWGQYGYAKGTAMWLKYMKVWRSLGVAKTEKISTGLGDELHAKMPSVLGSDFLNKGPRAALLKRAAKVATERNLLQTVTDTLVQNEREGAKTYKQGMTRMTSEVASEVASISSVLFNASENISRQVSFFMAFELAYDDYKAKNPGADEDAAFDHAIGQGVDMIRDTLGDYTSWERPRLAKSNWTRALFLFKMHAIVQTKFFVKNFNALVRGVGGNRAAAAKELTGVLMMAGLFGGLTGMPLYSIMAYALSEGFDDEDDEDVNRLMQLDPRTAYDSDIMFRRWIMEKFGPPVVELYNEDGSPKPDAPISLADILIHGPISVFTDTDLGSRTSLDIKNMWFREGSGGDNTSSSILNLVTANVAGAQMVMNIGRGIDDFNEGNFEEGLRKALPAFFRSWVASAQIASEGVQDAKGRVIIPKAELNELDAARAFTGFRSQGLARWQDYYITRAKNEKKIEKKKQRILDRLEKSIRQGDITSQADFDRFVEEEVVPFNRTYPAEGLLITDETIERSLKGRATSRAQTFRGMQLDKKSGQKDVEAAAPFLPR